MSSRLHAKNENQLQKVWVLSHTGAQHAAAYMAEARVASTLLCHNNLDFQGHIRLMTWKPKAVLTTPCFFLQMWCGPTSCHLSAKGRGGCPSGQTCVPIREGHCFVKPCSSFGECWHSSHPSPPTKCHPSSCYQDNSCTNITFTFNKETMPQVSHLCARGEIQVIFLSRSHLVGADQVLKTAQSHLKKDV